MLAAILGREVTFVRHSFSIKATRARLNEKKEKKIPSRFFKLRAQQTRGDNCAWRKKKTKKSLWFSLLSSIFFTFYPITTEGVSELELLLGGWVALHSRGWDEGVRCCYDEEAQDACSQLPSYKHTTCAPLRAVGIFWAAPVPPSPLPFLPPLFFSSFFSHFNVHLNRRRRESQVTSHASAPGAMSASQLTSRGERSLWWKPVVICSAGGQNASAPHGPADRLFLLWNSESKRYGALIEPSSGKTESGCSGVTVVQEKDKWRAALGCWELAEAVCF